MVMKSTRKRFTVLKEDGTVTTFEARVVNGKESYILQRNKDDILNSDQGRVDSCANVYAAKRTLGASYVLFERYHAYLAFSVNKHGYPSVVKKYAHDDQKWIDRVHDNPHMTKDEIIAQGLAEGHVMITPIKKKKKSKTPPNKKQDNPDIVPKPRKNRGRGALGRLFTARLLDPKKAA